LRNGGKNLLILGIEMWENMSRTPIAASQTSFWWEASGCMSKAAIAESTASMV